MGLEMYHFQRELRKSFDSDLELITDYDKHFKTSVDSTPEMRDVHSETMKKSLQTFNKKYIKRNSPKLLNPSQKTQLRLYNDEYGIVNEKVMGDRHGVGMGELDTNIVGLDITPRALKGIANAIHNHVNKDVHVNDIVMRDFLKLTESQLLKTSNLGKVSMNQIRELLYWPGYALRKE